MKQKTNSIAKSAVLVTAMMLAFKLLGFIKQAVIASYYGATNETDLYFIAWGFISGASEAIVKALGVSIVAIYTSVYVQKGKKDASRLINALIEIIVPLFCILMLVLMCLSPFISKMLAPSYDNDSRSRLSNYILVLAPIIVFSGIELIFGAVLDSHKSFFVPRLQSMIYSLSTILACVFLSSTFGIKALVVSQYVSYCVFTTLVVVAVRKYHLFFITRIKGNPELKKILITAIPLFIGNSALQINQIVDKSITSGIGEGAASALSYCHTLEQFVTNIMIVNIGNVMFANFAEYVAKGDFPKIRDTLSKALDLLIVILLGISIVTLTCSTEIVSIVYYRGEFQYNAVIMTATALCGYSLSFVAVAVRDLSVKSLYAFKDTQKPMLASIISICFNIVFSLILSRYIGILGVSLATSFSAIIGMVLNAVFLRKYLPDYSYRKHLNTFVKCIPAAIVLFAICILIKKILMIGSLGTFLLSSIIGLGVYFVLLYLCKIDSIKDISEMIVRRISNRKTP